MLFENAEAIEHLHKVDTLVVDKTGTLTLGRPRLVTVFSAQEAEDLLLGLAASLERENLRGRRNLRGRGNLGEPEGTT